MSSTKRRKTRCLLLQPISCFYMTSIPTVNQGRVSSIPNTKSVQSNICFPHHLGKHMVPAAQTVCSLPSSQHSCFKPNRHNLQIASGNIHTGLPTEAVSSSRPWETQAYTHLKPFPVGLYTFPQAPQTSPALPIL